MRIRVTVKRTAEAGVYISQNCSILAKLVRISVMVYELYIVENKNHGTAAVGSALVTSMALRVSHNAFPLSEWHS